MYKRKILAVALLAVLSVNLCGCQTLEHVEGAPATCTQTGNVEYWTDGTNYYADANGKEKLESVTLPALGHDVLIENHNATCTADGEQILTCSRCDYSERVTVEAKGHVFGDYVLISEATCEQEGIEARVCAVCKQTEERTLPALGHTIGTDNACIRGDWAIPVTDGLTYLPTQAGGFEIGGYTGASDKVVLPAYYEAKPVTGIANEAFRDNTELTVLTAYHALVRIGQSAFRGCRNLTAAELAGVEQIGNYAFYNCTALQTVALIGVKEIGISAFYGCSALTNITVSKGIEKIESDAFNGCDALTVMFLGTVAEWEQIQIDWTGEPPHVVCLDGEI